MKTVRLHKDGKSILANAGSQRERDLRKLGWSEKGAKPQPPKNEPEKPSAPNEPGNSK